MSSIKKYGNKVYDTAKSSFNKYHFLEKFGSFQDVLDEIRIDSTSICCLSGDVGSGCSAFTKSMLNQHVNNKGNLFIVDAGYSYKKYADEIGGIFQDVSDSEECSVELFHYVSGRNLLILDYQLSLVTMIVAQMARSDSSLNNVEMSVLESVIRDVWDSKGNDGSIDDVACLLSGFKDHQVERSMAARSIACLLERYCKGGDRSFLLSDFKQKSTGEIIRVVDLESLNADKGFQQVVCALNLYSFIGVILQYDLKNSLIVVNESWRLLGNGGGHLKKLLRSFFSLVKSSGAVFLSSGWMDMNDYSISDASAFVFKVSNKHFYFRQSPCSLAKAKENGLFKGFLYWDMISSLEKVDNSESNYYEFVFSTNGSGHRILRLNEGGVF